MNTSPTITSLRLDDLLALENLGWQALCRSEGGTFYGELMTTDAVMVVVNGMVLDRTMVARTLDESPPWTDYTISDARVVPVGQDSAILLYRASAVRDDGSEPFEAMMASHYRVLDGEIRLAFYQQTAL